MSLLFHRKKLRMEKLRKVLILQDFPQMINSVDSVFHVRRDSEFIFHQPHKSRYERIKIIVASKEDEA